MAIQAGGCLCGSVRYEVEGEPEWVTTCHCRFCQRATGAGYMIEPLFPVGRFRVSKGSPDVYDHRSSGSNKIVHVHFCSRCGTKTHLSFERFPQSIGVYAGTFDDPNWFEITPSNNWQIYLETARHDTIIPPGVQTFPQHGLLPDGSDGEGHVFDQPHVIGRRG